jgi:hypothetical protein
MDIVDSEGNTVFAIPKECSSFGALGMVDLMDLRGDTEKLRLRKVTKMPPNIAPLYEEVSKGITPRSLLTLALIFAEVNDGSAKELLEEFDMVYDVHDLGFTSGEEMSEDERRTIAQAIGLYNGFINMVETEISAQRTKIKKECADYKEHEVPVRCLAVESKPPVSDQPPADPPESGGTEVPKSDPLEVPPAPTASSSATPL